MHRLIPFQFILYHYRSFVIYINFIFHFSFLFSFFLFLFFQCRLQSNQKILNPDYIPENNFNGNTEKKTDFSRKLVEPTFDDMKQMVKNYNLFFHDSFISILIIIVLTLVAMRQMAKKYCCTRNIIKFTLAIFGFIVCYFE